MISIVIPTLERPRLLDSALASVAGQTWRDFEVVIVNDGGRSLRESVRPWRRRFPVTLIELDGTHGPAHARNVGIDHSQGSHIAFLDDDDIFLPHHLETAWNALDRDGFDFVYTAAVVGGRRLMSLPPDWAAMHRKSYPFNERFLLVANYLHTGSVVIRNLRNADARFDESLTHCEDWDLWIALTHKLGFATAFVDEMTTIYHQIPGTVGLVSRGQLTTPSPFAVAREYIYGKWPAADPLIDEYRRWFSSLEEYRNRFIQGGGSVPTHLFDSVLHFTYHRFAGGANIDGSVIPGFFREC